jgi:hypothetical protein
MLRAFCGKLRSKIITTDGEPRHIKIHTVKKNIVLFVRVLIGIQNIDVVAQQQISNSGIQAFAIGAA